MRDVDQVEWSRASEARERWFDSSRPESLPTFDGRFSIEGSQNNGWSAMENRQSKSKRSVLVGLRSGRRSFKPEIAGSNPAEDNAGWRNW